MLEEVNLIEGTYYKLIMIAGNDRKDKYIQPLT